MRRVVGDQRARQRHLDRTLDAARAPSAASMRVGAHEQLAAEAAADVRARSAAPCLSARPASWPRRRRPQSIIWFDVSTASTCIALPHGGGGVRLHHRVRVVGRVGKCASMVDCRRRVRRLRKVAHGTSRAWRFVWATALVGGDAFSAARSKACPRDALVLHPDQVGLPPAPAPGSPPRPARWPGDSAGRQGRPTAWRRMSFFLYPACLRFRRGDHLPAHPARPWRAASMSMRADPALGDGLRPARSRRPALRTAVMAFVGISVRLPVVFNGPSIAVGRRDQRPSAGRSGFGRSRSIEFHRVRPSLAPALHCRVRVRPASA